MSLNTIPESTIMAMDDAVKAGNVAFMRSALENFPELLHVKAPSSGGRSWLHVAVWAGRQSAAELVLAAGLPVDTVDDNSRTPLRIAASLLDRDMVRMLLDWDANPDGHTPFSPLHVAVRVGGGCGETVTELIRGGANIEIQDDSGYTPLMRASSACNFTAVRLLLSAGTNVFAVNEKTGETALGMAKQSGSIEVANYLEVFSAAIRAQETVDAAAASNPPSPRPL